MSFKGAVSLPFTTIEATTTTLLILAIALGTQGFTNELVKEEALSIKTDRVKNTVISLSTIPKGFMELDIEGYGIKVEGNNITMNYSDRNVSTRVDPSLIDSDISGPSSYEKVDGSLCIYKKSSNIEISPGGC